MSEKSDSSQTMVHVKSGKRLLCGKCPCTIFAQGSLDKFAAAGSSTVGMLGGSEDRDFEEGFLCNSLTSIQEARAEGCLVCSQLKEAWVDRNYEQDIHFDICKIDEDVMIVEIGPYIFPPFRMSWPPKDFDTVQIPVTRTNLALDVLKASRRQSTTSHENVLQLATSWLKRCLADNPK